MKKFYCTLVVFVMLIVSVVPISAQVNLTETYVSNDTSYEFSYPSGWTVTESFNFATVTPPTSNVLILAYSPKFFELFAGDATTMMDAMNQAIANSSSFGTNVSGTPFTSTIKGEEVVRVELATDAQSGFAMISTLSNGQFAMMSVLGSDDEIETFEDAVIAMALTFDEGTSQVAIAPTPEPEQETEDNQAQTEEVELPELYVASDNSYEFRYPNRWVVEEEPDEFTVLFNPFLNLTIFFIDPATILGAAPLATDGVDVVDVIQEFLERERMEIVIRTVDGRELTIATLVPEDEFSGYIVANQFDNGQYGVMIVSFEEGREDSVNDVIFSIAETFNTPSSITSGANPVQSLQQHAGDWQDAIAELENKGIIDSGGSLVFREEQAFFSGQGNFFTPLARRSPFTDIVMAAELDYRASSSTESETCGMMARVQIDDTGSTNSYLEIGVDNDRLLYFFDLDDGGQAYNSRILQNNVEIDRPQHILFIAQDDTLTVYLNGELILEGADIIQRSGTYGVGSTGRGPFAQCVVRNVWVYQAPNFAEGACEISSSNNVNKRSGPGTNFDRQGQIQANITENAVGQTTGSDGFVWYNLGDGSWVRSDVVRAQGDCANLPQVSN